MHGLPGVSARWRPGASLRRLRPGRGQAVRRPRGSAPVLDAFNVACSPNNRHLANARPAGPLLAYFNHDSWTDTPYAGHIVLIGDAAGWNDPINGLGLSITYRDVRIVSDILKQTEDWSAASFGPYAEERAERMRRLRFVGKVAARMDMEFDDQARGRRKRFLERLSTDPSVGMHLVAIMAGRGRPESTFTDDYLAQVLGEARMLGEERV